MTGIEIHASGYVKAGEWQRALQNNVNCKKQSKAKSQIIFQSYYTSIYTPIYIYLDGSIHCFET